MRSPMKPRELCPLSSVERFREEVNHILARLSEQATVYATAPESDREEMRLRALTCAYATAHTESRVAAQNLARGFIMRSGRVAIERRWQVPPESGDQNQREGKRIKWNWARNTAKARFARALCGYSLGADAVCLDVHMLRLAPHRRPRNAYQQWARWFRVYKREYGLERALWCLDWHRRLLDYCALVPGVSIGE